MSLLALAILAVTSNATPAVAVQDAPVLKGARPPGSANCPRTTSYYAFRQSDGPVKPRNLTELPPANMYAAVLRHDGRCEIPVIVKYGVGGR